MPASAPARPRPVAVTKVFSLMISIALDLALSMTEAYSMTI